MSAADKTSLASSSAITAPSMESRYAELGPALEAQTPSTLPGTPRPRRSAAASRTTPFTPSQRAAIEEGVRKQTETARAKFEGLDYAGAANGLREAVRVTPPGMRAPLRSLLFQVELAAWDFDSAKRTLGQLRRTEGETPEVQKLEALYDLKTGNATRAVQTLQALSGSNPADPSLLTTLSEAQSAARDPRGALASARAAVRAAQTLGDPKLEVQARERLAWQTLTDARSVPPGTPHPAQAEAQELLRLDPANRLAQRILAMTSPPPTPAERAAIRPLLAQAADAFARGDYRTALSQAEQAVDRFPGDAQAHSLRMAARRAVQETSAAELRGEPPVVQPFRDPAKVQRAIRELRTNGLDRLVKDFDRLSDPEKAVIAQALMPLGRILPSPPPLALEGSIRIADLDQTTTSLHPQTDDQTRSQDGRYLYGERGFHSDGILVMGRERLLEALHGGDNTFAHEVGHYLHGMLERYQPSAAKQIQDLYQDALAAHRRVADKGPLDWYAASNDREYFAQAYEAYLSKRKLIPRSDSEDNTRDELRRKDPEMLRFLDRLIGH